MNSQPPPIPESTFEAIGNNVYLKVPPSGFLYAVLTNNLREAFACADEENTAAMKAIVAYCYNKIPATCWGSPEKVRQWLEPKTEGKQSNE